MPKSIYLFLLLIIFIFSCKSKNTLFNRLDTKDTGISFSNRIAENDSINILRFDYIYNGAGVGVADFNKDGLQDLFFSGNQVENKLYLNKGEFKFEDISAKAQVSGKGKWCSGVAIVDINNDGWQDIYVAVTSTNNTEAARRENLLFVNQGIDNGQPTFKEMAAEYGINDNGHSENAAFFDFDNDGDLDLYVLTNKIGKWPNLFAPKITDGSNPNTDRLYRNDFDEKVGHAVFTNVSEQAGIKIEGYGLGLNITDINHDGWKDIYVTNDYVTNDLLYINNQDGTFTDRAAEYFKHTSQSAMGNDVADINNDGLQDIIALDMLPRDNERKKMFIGGLNIPFYEFSTEHNYTFQYMHNTLQLNNGAGQYFSDISFMADVAETDWSWAPSLADFDNDGFRDLLITNGFPRDVTDRDFMSYRAEIANLMDLDYILSQIPTVKISNYAFHNTGNLKFENVTADWGLEIPSFSNGAIYADLDNDGDLDYIVNNINDSAFVYRNNVRQQTKNNYIRFSFDGPSQNLAGIGTLITAENQKGESLFFEMNPYRGYKSSVENFAHFGLGSDSILHNITIIWPDHKYQKIDRLKANQLVKLNYKNAKGTYNFIQNQTIPIFEPAEKIPYFHTQNNFVDFNVQNLLPYQLSQSGPKLAAADINNDGLEDFYVCGSKNRNGKFFIQNATGGFKEETWITPTDSSRKTWEEAGALFFDADADGDQDLYIATGGNENTAESPDLADRFYENTGTAFIYLPNALPKILNSGGTVCSNDIDNDGDLDLFVAGHFVPHQYPKATSSFLFINTSTKGKINFKDKTVDFLPELNNYGRVSDALFADLDKNGQKELILANELGSINIFHFKNNKYFKQTNTNLENLHGMWSSIAVADIDQDGDLDLIAGNLGENTLLKGTLDEPAYFLSADFDNNNVYDIIPFVHFWQKNNKRKLVPYNTKDDINKMLNPTRSRFTTYKDFADADIDNLLLEKELKMAQKNTLNFAKSAVFINNGKVGFEIKPLPIKAQLAPIRDILIEDFNHDGHLDILTVGNNYGFELMTGRLDASNGLLLLGNGKGNFAEKSNTGFNAIGDCRSILSLKSTDKHKKIIVSQNQGPLLHFSVK